jgi:Ca2+-binding EF-hand superfamily protein/ABC-type amino acid transport substrate-binding protein
VVNNGVIGTTIHHLDEHYFAQVAKTFALAGYNVDIVVIVDAPFVMFDASKEGNRRFSGYCIEMVKEAARDLGFDYQLHLPSDASLTSTPAYFGTYGQGELDVLNQTLPVEIFWSGYFITKQRMQVFDMAYPFRSTALGLLVRNEVTTGKALSSTGAVFFPFTTALWGLILLTSIFSGAVLWFIEAPRRFENEQIEGNLGRSWHGAAINFGAQTWLTLATLLGFANHEPKTAAGKVYSLCYFTFCMLAMSAYTANLASIMTTEASTRGGITGMNDLIAKGKPVCVVENTAYGRWLQYESSWSDEINIRWTRGNEMVSSLREGLCDGVVATDIIIDYHLSNPANCELRKVGGAFWKQSLGVGLARTPQMSEFSAQLSVWVVTQWENVVFEEIEQRFMGTPCSGEDGARRRLRGRRRLKAGGGGAGSDGSTAMAGVSDSSDQLLLESMRLDTSHLGTICLVCFISGLASMLYSQLVIEPLDRRRLEKRVEKTLSKMIDADEDGKISFDEIGTDENLEAMLDSWNIIDYKKQGFLPIHSFEVFFCVLLEQLGMEGKDKRKKIASSVVETIDVDRDGTISYEEFSQFITDGSLRKFTRRASSSKGFGSKSETASQQGVSSSAARTSNVRAAQDAFKNASAGKPISAGSLPAAMASTSAFFSELHLELGVDNFIASRGLQGPAVEEGRA